MSFDTYISQFASDQVLSNEQVVSLHNLLKKGLESAREQLVKSNMRLVVKIANDYRDYGMEFEDIVSNGVLGLLKAIEVFDATKGDFSPCASVWINKYIRMGFDTGRSVHTKRYDRMTEEERSSCVVESLNEKVGDGEVELSDRLPMLVKRLTTVSGRAKYSTARATGASRMKRGLMSIRKAAPAHSRPSQAPRA